MVTVFQYLFSNYIISYHWLSFSSRHRLQYPSRPIITSETTVCLFIVVTIFQFHSSNNINRDHCLSLSSDHSFAISLVLYRIHTTICIFQCLQFSNTLFCSSLSIWWSIWSFIYINVYIWSSIYNQRPVLNTFQSSEYFKTSRPVYIIRNNCLSFPSGQSVSIPVVKLCNQRPRFVSSHWSHCYNTFRPII